LDEADDVVCPTTTTSSFLDVVKKRPVPSSTLPPPPSGLRQYNKADLTSSNDVEIVRQCAEQERRELLQRIREEETAKTAQLVRKLQEQFEDQRRCIHEQMAEHQARFMRVMRAMMSEEKGEGPTVRFEKTNKKAVGEPDRIRSIDSVPSVESVSSVESAASSSSTGRKTHRGVRGGRLAKALSGPKPTSDDVATSAPSSSSIHVNKIIVPTRWEDDEDGDWTSTTTTATPVTSINRPVLNQGFVATREEDSAFFRAHCPT
jgi:hypothetical protein